MLLWLTPVLRILRHINIIQIHDELCVQFIGDNALILINLILVILEKQMVNGATYKYWTIMAHIYNEYSWSKQDMQQANPG